MYYHTYQQVYIFSHQILKAALKTVWLKAKRKSLVPDIKEMFNCTNYKRQYKKKKKEKSTSEMNGNFSG